MSGSASIAPLLLPWFDRHGRKNLPWQQDISPYRVWVSETMLQQTQVATVIGYYERFMDRFPDIHQLAAAPLDEVLHLWSGLGYYSRARNLHRTAQIVVHDYEGIFPVSVAALMTLPGIGQSTAGAISSIALNMRAPILDGNVKRVLTRYHGVGGWPGKTSVSKQLWLLADQHTPEERVADYTQAIMDLGATLCRRTRPQCAVCPLQAHCVAFAEGNPTRYPESKPKAVKPVRNTHLLILRNTEGAILLEQRPPTGLWGGLWTLPECDDQSAIRRHCAQLGYLAQSITHGPPQRHSFSHYHLDYVPVLIDIKAAKAVLDSPQRVWYNPNNAERLGLPAPISKLIRKIHTTEKP